ncbi:MAG: hypothetical protein O7D92_05200 [Proteobacteria bacterium]|nr:hypothetical protein [Pseudomonadota bacterium]
MNGQQVVELTLPQRSIEPAAGETIVYFVRAQRSSATETHSAPVG